MSSLESLGRKALEYLFSISIPSKRPDTDKSTETFKKNEKLEYPPAQLRSTPPVKTKEPSTIKELAFRLFATKEAKAQRQETVVNLISEGKYEAALPLMKYMDKATVEDVLNKAIDKAKDSDKQPFITSVRNTFVEVSKLHKEHKLNAHQVVAISFIGQAKLKEVPPDTRGQDLYIKKGSNLPRTIRLNPDEGFYILNKSKVRGMFGIGKKSFLGEGGFKKATTTIRVMETPDGIKADSKVQAVIKDKKITKSELNYTRREGKLGMLFMKKELKNVIHTLDVFDYSKIRTKKGKETELEKTALIMEQGDMDLIKARTKIKHTDENCCQIFEGVASGISEMHNFTHTFETEEEAKEHGMPKEVTDGILHRDIKGGNILIIEENGKYTAKLADLGLVEDAKTASPSERGYGTSLYKAPETERRKNENIEKTKAQDMYALGCALYEFEFKTDVPWLNKDPHDPRSTPEIKKDLAEALNISPFDIRDPKLYRRYIICRLLDTNPGSRMTAKDLTAATEYLRKLTNQKGKQPN